MNVNKKVLLAVIIPLLLVLAALAFPKKANPPTSVPQPNQPATSDKCGLENCHGLELSCGPNVPDVCTFLYQLGDNCRQYAKCEVVNNRCQLITEPKFTQCKSCVEKCLADFKDDPVKTSACEGRCQDCEPISEP